MKCTGCAAYRGDSNALVVPTDVTEDAVRDLALPTGGFRRGNGVLSREE
jgi:hypothetical protein